MSAVTHARSIGRVYQHAAATRAASITAAVLPAASYITGIYIGIYSAW